jgi:lysophospholipase L1-like esterase
MKKIVWLAALLCLISSNAFAQRGGVSAPDPYKLVGTDGVISGFPSQRLFRYNYNGRTQVLASALSGFGTPVGVGIFIGTSTSDNLVNATYSPANPTKIYNLSIDNGGIYQSVEPLLGGWSNTESQPTTPAANGNFVHVLSDKLVAAGTYATFVNVPLGMTSSRIADWAVGAALNDRITVAFRRLAALGLSANFVVIQVGENDTAVGTSQASYAASQSSVISTIRNSFAGTILISTTSYTGGTTSANVTNAQAAAINNGLGIYAGPNTDLVLSAGRWDNTHPNATGALSWANSWVTQIGAAPH